MSGMLSQEQAHSLVSRTMNEHITSRPATPEERSHITDFLFDEYLKIEYGHDIANTVWTGQETDDDLAIEADLAYITNIMDESDIHTYPNFFPDADLIEVRIWPVNFLNTVQHFKQFSDGQLIRSPHHTDRTQQAVYEKIEASTTDWWWTCVCGNEPSEQGFSGCDQQGKVVIPTTDNNPTDWSVCERCGRIFEVRSLKVIGQRQEQVSV